jgi:hypothetical protein
VFFLAVFVIDWDGENDYYWEEEVKISNGDVIVVERYAHFFRYSSISLYSDYETKKMSLEIVSPDVDSPPSIWEGPFIPIVFDKDIEDGEWYIIATWRSTAGRHKAGTKNGLIYSAPFPKTNYIEFRFKNGEWVKQFLQDKYLEKRTPANLFGQVEYSGQSNLSISKKEKIIPNIRVYMQCVTDKPFSNDGCK